MKYTQLLDTNMVPEWRNQYLDYHGLDSALNKAIESKNMKARQKGVDLYFELIKFNQKFASFFQRECQCQLDKINTFHREKLNEMKGKFNNLHDQLDQVLSSAIYREIQPDLAWHHSNNLSRTMSSTSCNSSSCPIEAHDHETLNCSTVSSISELFRNLKGSRRMGAGDGPVQQNFNSIRAQPNGNHHHTLNHNILCQPRQQGRRISQLFPKSVSKRLSLMPVLNNGDDSTTRLRRDSASLNFRMGRERITVMGRKLSESFTASANKISNNFHSFQNTFNSHNNHHHPHHYGDDSLHKRLNPVAQKLTTSSSHINSSEVLNPHQQHQQLAGAMPQSKSKIVASYKKKLSNLKFAFRELYFNLVLFEQYTQLNHNGFQQILRKHDRMFASSLGRKFYEEHVQTADFYNDLQAIDHLIENVEHIYTLHFEHGNRRRAIEKLQVPANVYKPSSTKLDFRVGYEFGMFTILFILVVLMGLISDTEYDWRTVFRLYRSPMVLIIFLFQTGISIVIWKHYKINHVLIFELNPRDNLSFQHFIEFGSQLGIIWSISVLLFLFSGKFDIKPSILPLIVVLIIIIYLFNPTQTCTNRARFWLIKRLGRIFIAPFGSGRVRFADFWIADQLVSIVPLFLDLEYLFCFYTTDDVLSKSHLTASYVSRCVTRNPQDLVIRTIVAALPAWFRCAQCLRRWRDENWLRLHLANAGKYWCMVMVVMLSSISQYNKSSFGFDTWRIVWMVAAIFTSSLTAYWDIIYDFGLFNKYDKEDVKDNISTGGGGGGGGGSGSNRSSRSGSSSINMANYVDTDHEMDDLDTGSPKFGRKAEKGTSSQPHVSNFESEQFYMNPNKKKNKQYPFLRKELVYPVWVYYFAIVENIILRFGWIITISLTEFSGIEAGLVVSLLAPMEMFRRFVWNCIRLENEQLNNCGLFRAVRDIPMEVVAPIDESHLDKVIMMMDSRDGPSMRNRLMKRRTLRPDRVSFMVLQRPGSADDMTRRCNVRSD